MTRFDKLGRRIKDFDRSASNKKGAATKKKENPNHFIELGAQGGRAKKPGYFGKLKEEDPEKLKELSAMAAAARKANRAAAEVSTKVRKPSE